MSFEDFVAEYLKLLERAGLVGDTNDFTMPEVIAPTKDLLEFFESRES